MKKIITIILLLLANAINLQAGERAYLFLDNTAYFLGDTLRLSAYVMDTATKRLTNKSKVLYVELLAPEGYLVESRTYPLTKGRCAGDIYLRPLLLSGLFEIRAYTRYMQNDGDVNYFSKAIPVYEQVKDGLFSNLSIRKRKVRNNGQIVDKVPQNIKCQKCTDKDASSNTSFRQTYLTVKTSYDVSKIQPYELATIKLKGTPHSVLSLSVMDKDSYITTFSNVNIADFYSQDDRRKDSFKEQYEPEQGITVYGKVGSLVENGSNAYSFVGASHSNLAPVVFFKDGYSKVVVSTNQTGNFSSNLGNFMGDAFLQLKFADLKDSSALTKFIVSNPNDSIRLRKFTKSELELQNKVDCDGKIIKVNQIKHPQSLFSAVRFDLIKTVDRIVNEEENAILTNFPNLWQVSKFLTSKYSCKKISKIGFVESLDNEFEPISDSSWHLGNRIYPVIKYKTMEMRSDKSSRLEYMQLNPSEQEWEGIESASKSSWQVVTENSSPTYNYTVGAYPSVVCCMTFDKDHEWDKYLKYNQIPHSRCLKVSGFSPQLPYHQPNYSKSHPGHDYRRTLYWNPDVQLDENGEATIQFYNNGTCKQFVISGEGVSEDGKAIVVE